jgi:methylmalonyl-CoA mutase
VKEPVMEFPRVTLADWRIRVDKELAGRSFDKVLVHETPEGLSIAPLYTEAPAGPLSPRETGALPFRICVRHEASASRDDLKAEIAGGADAVWLAPGEMLGALPADDLRRSFFVFDPCGASPLETFERATSHLPAGTEPRFALNCDPIAERARGLAPFAALSNDLAAMGRLTRRFEGRFERSTAVMVSTLAYHDAGADGADEIAIALSTGVRYLDALLESGLSLEWAARQIALQVAVGRDTFFELCKVRALRTCWQKVLAGAGLSDTPRTLVHAVCSSRTLTVRDPWVNMLRVTTQVFAAALGGADLITPSAFDRALGSNSALGRRVARNTGLVLREESFLGKVTDPAGGSYYFETLTDAIARASWKRFRAFEQEGGIVAALEHGSLATKLDLAWQKRLEQIARRKLPVLGVSEFANLDETLPSPAPDDVEPTAPHVSLPIRRDSAAFENLRLCAERNDAPEVLLVTLGTLSESRPRAGFAAGFFAAGGMRTRESTVDEKARIACLCGSDERYTDEAMARVRALKAAGCDRVLVAGKPGALETALRGAGADGFIFLGCDVVAILAKLLDLPS